MTKCVVCIDVSESEEEVADAVVIVNDDPVCAMHAEGLREFLEDKGENIVQTEISVRDSELPISHAKGLVGKLNDVMDKIISGEMEPDHGLAVCAVADQAMKIIEAAWRLKKEIETT